MTPRESEPKPEEDEDEFYYSLNRSGAKKQDASFGAVGIGAVVGALLCAPLGVFGLFLMFITIPLCAVMGAVLGAGVVIAWNALAARYISRPDN